MATTTTRNNFEDVCITSSGVTCGLGNGVEEVMRAALAGSCGIRDCSGLLLAEGFGLAGTHRAALVHEHAALMPATETSRATRYALAAAGEALRGAGLVTDTDAGPALSDVDPDRIGVITGSAAPAADMYFAVSQRALGGRRDVVTGRTGPNLSAHAPAAALALQYGLRGPNLAVSAACATGTLVVLAAADQIRAGRADVVVAVAAESAVSAIGLTSFERARALGTACRPFDRDRNGLVMGEGAAAVVVESAAHASARGAKSLATIRGGALTDDAHHMWKPDVGSWARTMQLAIRAAGLSAFDIDYVSAHAAGTPVGDASEVAALRKALGGRAEEVPVWSTKGMHGHVLGASGAIEIVIALNALRAGRVPQTVGLLEPAPDCDLDHVPDAGRAGKAGIVMKDAFGFGGTNCVLVLDVHIPESDTRP